MRTKLLSLIGAICLFSSCKKNPATPPPIENNKALSWAKTFGGSNYDFAQAIVQTADGGYVYAGASRSTDGDVSASPVGYDAWILKTDLNGAKVWSKTYGSSNDDYSTSIITTADGGYLVGGYTFI